MKKVTFLLLFLIEAQLSFAQSNPVNASVLDTVSKSDFRIPFWHPHFRGLHEYKITLERNNLFVTRTDNVKDLEDWSKVENTLNLFIKDFPQVVDSTRSPLESRSLLYLVSGNDRTLEIKYHTPQKESFRLSMTDGINQLKTQQDSVIIRVGQNEINKNYCILLLINQIEDLATAMDELKAKFLKLNNNPKLILKPDNRNRLSILNVLNEDSNLRFEKIVKWLPKYSIEFGGGITKTGRYLIMGVNYNFMQKQQYHNTYSSFLIGASTNISTGLIKSVISLGMTNYKKQTNARFPLGYYLDKKSMIKFGIGEISVNTYKLDDQGFYTYKNYLYGQMDLFGKLHKDFYWHYFNGILISKTDLNFISYGIGIVWYPSVGFSIFRN